MVQEIRINSIQIKRGSKAALEQKLIGNLKLIDGEIAFEKDTGKLKVGNGIQDYKDLPYVANDCVDCSIIFKIKAEFPIEGQKDKLYIATDEKNMYIWNIEKSIYESISSQTQFDIIDGGSAADWAN